MARIVTSQMGPSMQYSSQNGVITSASLAGGLDDYYQLSRGDIVKRVADASGWREPTSYTATLNTYSDPHGEYAFSSGGVNYRYWGGNRPEQKGMASLPAFPSGLRQRAEVNALLKLKDQKVNLGQAIGERKQTIRLVANNLKAIAKMRRTLVKAHSSRLRRIDVDGNVSGGFRKSVSPTFLADRWLELQYGWKPLLSDIYGSIELIDVAEQREGPRRYRLSVMGKLREDSKMVRTYEGPGSNRLFKAEELTRTMHGCKVKLYYEPSDAAPFQTLAQSGITNPLELAWELLPYSFIVDWALPIGDWLSTLDADIGWKFLSGTVSEITRVRQRTAYSKGSNPIATGAHGKHGSQRLRLIRTVYTATPMPRPPSFKDPRSAMHLANALALLTSAFGRGSSRVRT